jgi:hypothetical protein
LAGETEVLRENLAAVILCPFARSTWTNLVLNLDHVLIVGVFTVNQLVMCARFLEASF